MSTNFKLSLIKRYDETASKYDSFHIDEQIPKYTATLKKLHYTPHQIIGDFGCGTGLFLKENINDSCLGIGIDISLKELYIANLKNNSNIQLIQADIDFPPFKNKIFDKIFLFTVLHHYKNSITRIKKLCDYTHDILGISLLKRNLDIPLFDKLISSFKLDIIDEPKLVDIIILIKINHCKL